jgi:hypothetical protein
MQKAAWIRVAITVAGDAPPASDFSQLALDAVRANIYEDADPPPDGTEFSPLPTTATSTATPKTRRRKPK